MENASIVVDIRHMRCSNCKVALHDELAIQCPVCNATFTHVTSNHVGLAEKLERRRRAAGITSDERRAIEQRAPALVEK
jgi:hypothetical protein